MSSFPQVLQTVHDPEVLLPVVQALGNISNVSTKLRSTIGSTNGLIASLVSLFETSSHPGLLLALTNSVSDIAKGDKANQSAFVNEGITHHIVNVVMHQIRNKEIQVTFYNSLSHYEVNRYTTYGIFFLIKYFIYL